MEKYYTLTLYRRSADRFIYCPSPYRAVNTLYLGYKNQAVYAVSGTSSNGRLWGVLLKRIDSRWRPV